MERARALRAGSLAAVKPPPTAIERRRFLRHVWHGVGAGIGLALLPGRGLRAAPRFGRDPFTLGVASGDPTPEGIVLWTRLAPDPANPGRLRDHAIPVG